MEWEDIVYLCLLSVTIILGPFIRKIESTNTKKYVSTALGFAIVYAVSGWHIVHTFLVTILNSVIVLYVDKRYCHNVSLVFCFLYLAFFRTVHLLGLPEPAAHLNAIEMMHTLKMVGLAFEMRDTSLRKRELDKDKQKSAEYDYEYEFTKVKPNCLDIIHYSFCYVGLLAGPFYKYRTYWDWLHLPFSKFAPATDILFARLAFIPLFALGYLIGNYIYPLGYTENEIYNCSFLYRWWYMTPLFFNFRMRLYIGFGLSECSCIAAGLGLYPTVTQSKPGQGPTNYEQVNKCVLKDELKLRSLKYDYEAVHNINEYGAEFVATVREGMRCWNMTVQYWLAVFIHKRVRHFRVAVTMLTSAFWHGVYPGYYFCLLTVPFVLMAEGAMDKALRRDATPRGQALYDWICWVFKMQAFSYMGMAFYLLRVEEIIRFWGSLYFMGHILIIVFYLLGRTIVVRRRSSQKLVNHSKSKVENDVKGIKSE